MIPSAKVEKDLKNLGCSVSTLKEECDSVAEIALQNRRRLDSLFFRRGGLYMALGETCSFYTNKSGVIRQSLAENRDIRPA